MLLLPFSKLVQGSRATAVCQENGGHQKVQLASVHWDGKTEHEAPAFVTKRSMSDSRTCYWSSTREQSRDSRHWRGLHVLLSAGIWPHLLNGPMHLLSLSGSHSNFSGFSIRLKGDTKIDCYCLLLIRKREQSSRKRNN